MLKNETRLLIAILFILGSYTGFAYWDKYKERDLLDTLQIEREGTNEIFFFLPPVEGPYSWRSTDGKVVDEWIEYLHSFRVVRSKVTESESEEFSFSFHLGNKQEGYSSVFVVENSKIIVDSVYYDIVDDAFDDEWVEKFNRDMLASGKVETY